MVIDKYLYYEEPNIKIYCADCRDILPYLDPVDLVLTDPPYGVNMLRGDSKIRERIINDDIHLDISWVAKQKAIIWGGNQFCHQLPISGGWLVWYKYVPEMGHHSQAELAWSNVIKTVRHWSQQFTGFMCDCDGTKQHPTQKPTALMKWCISLADPVEIEEKYCQIAVERLRQEVLI